MEQLAKSTINNKKREITTDQLYSHNALSGFEQLLSQMPQKNWIEMHGSHRFPVYPGWKKGLQIQDDLHIMFIREGEGYYYMDDGQVIPLKKGSLVFISNNYPHKASHNIKNPIHISGFRFGLCDYLGNSIRTPVQNPFYYYVPVKNYQYYDDMAIKIHTFFHGNYEDEVKKTCSLLIHQILNDMYLLISNKVYNPRNELSRVAKAKKYIEKHLYEKISVIKVAEHVSISVRYLQKIFKAELGYTPKEYHLNIQMDTAYNLLHDEYIPVKQVAQKLGYSDQYIFSHQFKKHFGVSPSIVKNTFING